MRLIDADAIEYTHAVARNLFDGYNWNELVVTKDEIEDMPTIQPEPHWIPVTERLPENGRQVLIFATSVHYALAKYDEMREADGTYKKQWVTFDAWKPFYSIKEVIAWCELPELSEPYRCIGR